MRQLRVSAPCVIAADGELCSVVHHLETVLDCWQLNLQHLVR